jgi:tetratricopeptide (TPR) repeat protein
MLARPITDGSTRRRTRRVLPSLILGGLLAGAAWAGSEPFVPDSDATILQRLPAGTGNSQLRALQAQLGSDPAHLPAVLQLARAYIEVARNAGDSRYSSYALATLAPWLQRSLPARDAAQVLTLTAIAQQNLHRFDPALASLAAALRLDPDSGQAWLTQASVLALRGRYAEARRACAPLVRTYDQLIALTCIASVDGRSGKLQSSYAALRTVYRDDPRLDPALRVWITTELADMAERLDKPAEARQFLAAALAIDPRSIAVKAALADLMLRQGEPAQVLALLAQDADQDALLLRLAIAAQRVAATGARAYELANLYQQRVIVALRPDEPQHLREQARFLLEVRQDAGGSLQVARENFAIQREPEDIRIYRRAVRAAGAAGARDLALLEQWQRGSGYEDLS